MRLVWSDYLILVEVALEISKKAGAFLRTLMFELRYWLNFFTGMP